MIERPRHAFRWHRGDDRGNRAFGGHATCTDLQLQHKNTAHVSNETGVSGVSAFERGLAASRLVREGPAIGHRFIRSCIRFGVIQHHHFAHTNSNYGSSDSGDINNSLCGRWYGIVNGCCPGHARVSGSAARARCEKTSQQTCKQAAKKCSVHLLSHPM